MKGLATVQDLAGKVLECSAVLAGPVELAVSWWQSRVICLLSAFLLPESQSLESRVSLAPQWPLDTTPPRGSGLVPTSGSLRPQPCQCTGGSSILGFHVGAI